MSKTYHLLDLPFDCETSQAYTVHLLRTSGLHAKPTFELDSACGSLSTGICSHDPNSSCSCRLVVLRVADFTHETVSLILHSYDNKTEIFLEEAKKTTGQEIKDRITKALVY
jgi:hypothetical protein